MLYSIFLHSNAFCETFYKFDFLTQDVLTSLKEKLSLKCLEHFSLVCEHIKFARRHKITLLNPKDTLAKVTSKHLLCADLPVIRSCSFKIAARPGAHNLRCLFRITFVPKDAHELLQNDPIAFEYLYQQCCNDVVQERFSPELKYEVALRLSALHLQEHSLSSNGMQNNSGKLNLKTIDKECGLEPFLPFSLLDSMKRKELLKVLGFFLKQNLQFCPPGQKSLTPVQIKLHYLKIISELPSYGAKIFASNILESSTTIESTILVSPKYGISHINSVRNSLPTSLAKIGNLKSRAHILCLS